MNDKNWMETVVLNRKIQNLEAKIDKCEKRLESTQNELAVLSKPMDETLLKSLAEKIIEARKFLKISESLLFSKGKKPMILSVEVAELKNSVTKAEQYVCNQLEQVEAKINEQLKTAKVVVDDDDKYSKAILKEADHQVSKIRTVKRLSHKSSKLEKLRSRILKDKDIDKDEVLSKEKKVKDETLRTSIAELRRKYNTLSNHCQNLSNGTSDYYFSTYKGRYPDKRKLSSLKAPLQDQPKVEQDAQRISI